jgi:hypothetical protein
MTFAKANGSCFRQTLSASIPAIAITSRTVDYKIKSITLAMNEVVDLRGRICRALFDLQAPSLVEGL